MKPEAPDSLDELLCRAEQLAGYTLTQVADTYHYPMPTNTKSEKGWIGQLLEYCLGATAGSRAEPDFPHLGVEMKTLPVTPDGKPAESTYVCTLPLNHTGSLQWENSWVRRKLKHILWFPVQSSGTTSFGQRRLGSPFLWQPDSNEERSLRKDWEEIMEMICSGRLHELTARHGAFLQVRPKAANSRALCQTISHDGKDDLTLPRGFYLRTRFTEEILARQFS